MLSFTPMHSVIRVPLVALQEALSLVILISDSSTDHAKCSK